MKRVLAHLASVGLFLVVVGCAHQYDIRLEKAVDHLKNEKDLNENLEPPGDTKSNLATAHIYVRPPLGFKPTEEFGFTLTEPDKFDITRTFFSDKGSLHIIARHDKPKGADSKKGAKAAEPKAPRGDFIADVSDLLKNLYQTDFPAKPKSDPHTHEGKTMTYKMLELHPPGKEVRVYIHGEKNSPEQVALIFEYPEGELKGQSRKIDLCLGSFRVGEAARRLYSGQDEETGEGGAAPPTGVF
jgi:hypothetical protein